MGGSKVSTKLEVLSALSEQVDALVPGGGIANTFFGGVGHSVGQSLYEPELMDAAKRIMDKTRIPMPVDVVVADAFSETANIRTVPVGDVADAEMILDVGPETVVALSEEIERAKTIIWNGPLGVFEMSPFAEGTKTLAEAIAASDAFSIAGGGDTLAAIEQFGVTDAMSYISTGEARFWNLSRGRHSSIAALEALTDKETDQLGWMVSEHGCSPK